MRRLLVGLALALTVGAGIEAWAGTRFFSARIYDCDTGITLLASSNPNRRNLTLINVGTIHVGLAGGEHARATLLANGFFTLHAGSAIEFANFQGGVLCTAAGPVRINVMDEIE